MHFPVTGNVYGQLVRPSREVKRSGMRAAPKIQDRLCIALVSGIRVASATLAPQASTPNEAQSPGHLPITATISSESCSLRPARRPECRSRRSLDESASAAVARQRTTEVYTYLLRLVSFVC